MFSRKMPFYLQHDSTECGITCLRIICKYYGKDCDMSILRHLCFTSKNGTSLLDLNKLAVKLGFETLGCISTVDDLRKSNLPCILHWERKHFVVLYKITIGNKFVVCDPGKGFAKYDEDTFLSKWIGSDAFNRMQGVVLFLTPSNDFNNTKSSLNSNITWRQSVKHVLSENRNKIAKIALMLFVVSGLQLSIPFLTQAIVDVGIKNSNITLVKVILIGEIAFVLSRAVAETFQNWLILVNGIKIGVSMVCDYFIKLVKLPMTLYETRQTGDLIQRMDDHENIGYFLTRDLPDVMLAFFSLAVYGTVLCVYQLKMMIIFCLTAAVYALWTYGFMKKRYVCNHEIFESQSNIQTLNVQFLTSIQEIKIQGCSELLQSDWKTEQDRLLNSRKRLFLLDKKQTVGGMFINEVRNVLITLMTAEAVVEGSMTLGMMLAVQYIVGQLNYPLTKIMNFVYSIQDAKISSNRINEIKNMKNEDSKTSKCDNVEKTDIVFKNVCYKYNPHTPKHNVYDASFKILSGQTTAVVGESGSGKTTLMKLALGYYQLESGNISIGKDDIKNINHNEWRKRCGVVLQDGCLFNYSIARNIALDSELIDYSRVIMCAKVVKIHEKIMNLPLAYDTLVGSRGVRLSPGEKQRVLIARALYKSPHFFFFDEATNALDSETEKSITDALTEYLKGKTVFIIAHRLSTIVNADQIIVMKNGRIVERGNHKELIIKNGYYYSLIKNQINIENR